MSNLLLFAMISVVMLGQQPEKDTVTKSELGAPGAPATTQESPGKTLEPVEAEPAQTPEEPRNEAPRPPDKKEPAPDPGSEGKGKAASGKRVAAFWVILPEK